MLTEHALRKTTSKLGQVVDEPAPYQKLTGTIYFTGEDDVDQSAGVGEGARPRRRAWVRLRPRVVASN